MNDRNKKFFYTGLLILGLLLTLGLGSAYARETLIRNASIDSTSAKNFALIDAGVQEKDLTYIDIDFEKEYGTYLYDIEFIANGVKYYYHINAADGQVLSKNSRNTVAALTDDLAGQSKGKTTTNQVETSSSVSMPNEAKAESSSLSTKNTSSSTNAVQKKQEPILNPAPKHTTGTATPTKNAETTSQITTNVVQSNNYINIEKAKSIALTHANIAYNTAIFETAKLEEDDGKMIYDIEFFTSDKEYDYEINAYTGEILKFSSERQEKLPANIINQKQNQNAATNHILHEDDDFDDDFDDVFDNDSDDFDDDDNDD